VWLLRGGKAFSHADSFNTENFTEWITCVEQRLCAWHCVSVFGHLGGRGEGERESGREEGRAPFIKDGSEWMGQDRFGYE